MKKFSKAWIASKNPKKQRKFVYNAPLHLRTNLVVSHLSKDLRKKYGRRGLRVRVGDKVVVMRGQFRRKSGKVERISTGKCRAFITGIETVKKDGSKALYPIHASNLMITELNLGDKRRVEVKK
jgi:large subunit ribosomal protein L24